MPSDASALRWLSWAVAVTWTSALALIDGWRVGVAGRLATDQEYLYDVPKVADIGVLLRTFSDHILTNQILTNQPMFWTTHVGAHPPGIFLLFVWLDRIGLGGGGWVGTLVILVGASAGVAVAVTLRAVGAEPAARAALPFLVLFPGAVWVGVSADGLFAGVLAWALAFLAVGATRAGLGGDLSAVAGGLLLGYTLYLSYGLVLALPLALVVAGAIRNWRVATVSAAAAVAVAAVFTAAGFWWLTGYHDVTLIYAASIAKDRPYSYFVWANLAAFACATGPAVVAGLRRVVALRLTGPPAVVALLAAAVLAVAAADLGGMSKGEVERIWLPFGIWLVPACAWLPQQHQRRWLAAQGLLAVTVNSLLLTVW
jgi:methylthioxylose transferase